MLLLLSHRRIVKTWDFRFFLPLCPPPKGETQIFANIEIFKVWLEYFLFRLLIIWHTSPFRVGARGRTYFLNLSQKDLKTIQKSKVLKS